MNLSPRLAAVAGLVTKDARIVDVGTDHGYLPVWLALEQKCKGIIATDVRQMPLTTGMDNAKLYGVPDKIDFRLCDGLALVSPEEADEIIICGMGGELMCNILSAAPWHRDKRLILQPASGADKLRSYLYASGMKIISEKLAYDGGLLYNIIEAERGEVYHPSPIDNYVSPALLTSRDPYLPMYLERMENVLRKAEQGAGRSSKPQDKQRYHYFHKALEEIVLMRKEYCNDNS